ENISSHIKDSQRFKKERGLGVYHDGYRLRLHEVLQCDFEIVEKLLGDKEFFNAAMAYIDKYPSHHFSVRYYGQYFAQFLRENAPYNNDPFLAEMADFEWSSMSTLDASNENIATIEDLQNFPVEQWANMCIRFHSSVCTTTFSYDIPQLWKWIEADSPP